MFITLIALVRNYLMEFGKNRIFWVSLSAWFTAQSIKVVLCVLREKRFDFRWFGDSGGMPSSHSTAVSALSTLVGLTCGFDSIYFAITVTFTIIVICDAQGARYAAGQQAEILNRMLEDVYWKEKIDRKRLKELIGHTPAEVFAGVFLGIVIALLFYK